MNHYDLQQLMAAEAHNSDLVKVAEHAAAITRQQIAAEEYAVSKVSGVRNLRAQDTYSGLLKVAEAYHVMKLAEMGLLDDGDPELLSDIVEEGDAATDDIVDLILEGAESQEELEAAALELAEIDPERAAELISLAEGEDYSGEDVDMMTDELADVIAAEELGEEDAKTASAKLDWAAWSEVADPLSQHLMHKIASYKAESILMQYR